MIVTYEIQKRRYLNRARLAFPDKYILSKFTEASLYKEDIHKIPIRLRTTISKNFYLSETLTFRQNATQCFRDILVGLLYYQGLIKNPKDFRVFITDTDHAVMRQMVEIIMPASIIYECQLLDKVVFDNKEHSSSVSDFFIEQVKSSNSNVVIVPHVNWINGAKLDVLFICKKIKEYDSSIVTIVDGAQAIANTQTIIDTGICNQDIDFYLGCGQKWLGSPIPIGFVRVSDRFCNIPLFEDFLFIGDLFSIHAGVLKTFEKKYLDTYHIPFSILLNSSVQKTFEDINGDRITYYYDLVLKHLQPIRTILQQSSLLSFLDARIEMQTGMLAVTSETKIIDQLSQMLFDKAFEHSKNKIQFGDKEISFLRFSSPLEKLKSSDLKEFEKIIDYFK